MEAALEESVVDVAETLFAYAKTLQHGDVVSYVEVEQATGIAMHPPSSGGRRMLFRALRKVGHVVKVRRGESIEVSSESSASSFVLDDLTSLRKKTTRVGKRAKHLLGLHGDKMLERDKQFVIGSYAATGAVGAAIDLARGRKPVPKIEAPPAARLPLQLVRKT